MMHLRGLMFGRESIEAFHTCAAEDTSYSLKDETFDYGVSRINGPCIAAKEAFQEVRQISVSSGVALGVNANENAKISTSIRSPVTAAVLKHDDTKLKATEISEKKDSIGIKNLEQKYPENASAPAPRSGKSLGSSNLSSVTSALRTKLRPRFFTSPSLSSPINSSIKSGVTSQQHQAHSETCDDVSQCHALLTEDNLTRNTSDPDTFNFPLSPQPPPRLLSTVRKNKDVVSITELSPLQESTEYHTVHQSQENRIIVLPNDRCGEAVHTNRTNTLSKQDLVVTKTRKPLPLHIIQLSPPEQRIDQTTDLQPSTLSQKNLNSRRPNPSPVQPPTRSKDSLVQSKIHQNLFNIAPRVVSLRSITSPEDHLTVRVKSKRFLGRYRTPSTPEYLLCQRFFHPIKLLPRSLSLVCLKHIPPDRKTTLFIAIPNRTLYVPSSKRRAIIHVTVPNRRASYRAKRVPVLTPNSIFKIDCTTVFKYQTPGDMSCDTPNSGTGVEPNSLHNGVPTPPQSGSARRGASNQATNGSVSGFTGVGGPPGSPDPMTGTTTNGATSNSTINSSSFASLVTALDGYNSENGAALAINGVSDNTNMDGLHPVSVGLHDALIQTDDAGLSAVVGQSHLSDAELRAGYMAYHPITGQRNNSYPSPAFPLPYTNDYEAHGGPVGHIERPRTPIPSRSRQTSYSQRSGASSGGLGSVAEEQEVETFPDVNPNLDVTPAIRSPLETPTHRPVPRLVSRGYESGPSMPAPIQRSVSFAEYHTEYDIPSNADSLNAVVAVAPRPIGRIRREIIREEIIDPTQIMVEPPLPDEPTYFESCLQNVAACFCCSRRASLEGTGRFERV